MLSSLPHWKCCAVKQILSFVIAVAISVSLFVRFFMIEYKCGNLVYSRFATKTSTISVMVVSTTLMTGWIVCLKIVLWAVRVRCFLRLIRHRRLLEHRRRLQPLRDRPLETDRTSTPTLLLPTDPTPRWLLWSLKISRMVCALGMASCWYCRVNGGVRFRIPDRRIAEHCEGRVRLVSGVWQWS